tara:strand:+ start:130 stop:465 length:336 start_codon:yes stop_codon:yes gene_type:complete
MKNLEDILTFTKFERIYFNTNTCNKRILNKALALDLVIETHIGKRRFFEVVNEEELLKVYPEFMIDEKTKEKYRELAKQNPFAEKRRERILNDLMKVKWTRESINEILKDA